MGVPFEDICIIWTAKKYIVACNLLLPCLVAISLPLPLERYADIGIWQIEVFFKTCKSMLNLLGECHSLSYDALTAHVAIVFTRYMLLAMEQRQNEDQRALGELFFFLVDEMADITFNRSLCILMDALMASLEKAFFLYSRHIKNIQLGKAIFQTGYFLIRRMRRL